MTLPSTLIKQKEKTMRNRLKLAFLVIDTYLGTQEVERCLESLKKGSTD
jgi:hypothetical protein